MKVLGLGGSNHDFSACLVVNGQVHGAIEEERITRIKHSLGLGLRAVRCRSVDYLLQDSGLTLDDIDLIVGNDILDPKYYERFKNRIHIMNHHLAHAGSSYYVSGFQESAILVVDGYGSPIEEGANENETISFYHATEGNIERLQQVSGILDRSGENPVFENSIGAFYLTVTRGLGFDFLQEGKTMGLAAYGSNSLFVQDFAQFYDCSEEEGAFRFTRKQMQDLAEYIERVLSTAQNEQEVFAQKANLAYAGQYHVEQTMVKLSRYLHKQTKSDFLCLAGGVALNSVANYKILEQTPFKKIFIQPAAGDAGTAIGSAFYGHFVLGKQQWTPLGKVFSPYLGKNYGEEEYAKAISMYQGEIEVMEPDQIESIVSNLLAEGKIIGYFNSRSEVGPRALGNRSILADARNPLMKDIINERIKHRESFRPFAPIVLEEYQTEFFEMSHPSHYMLFVPPVLQAKYEVIPSVTHHDGTGRVQTIHQDINPNIHKLLSEFHRLTGVPVLLNTSFNDNGEPIVESPVDALKCFLKIDLDYLVLGRYLIHKKKETTS